jgi:hypothetical protein
MAERKKRRGVRARVADHRSPVTGRPNHRPIEFGGPLGDLVEIYGTCEALAEAIGTSARSIRRWATGNGFPSLPAGKMLVIIAAKHGITAEQLRPILEGRGSVYPADFKLR